jgi:hypothetical protein
MMIDYGIPVHAQGLRDEILAASLPVAAVHGDGRVVMVEDEPFDRAALDAVVAAHSPAEYEVKEQEAKHSYDDAVAFLQTYYKTANAQITVDQTKNAIRALTVLARTQHQALAEDA